eukprot:9424824-Lingulodinium_polyedra.AAC.1
MCIRDRLETGEGALPPPQEGRAWRPMLPEAVAPEALAEVAGWARLEDYVLLKRADDVCGVAVTRDPDAEGDEDDARIMPIARLPGGRRHCSYRDAVALLRETEWGAWPAAGPRATFWRA